jgi:hypothetical protein
MKLRFTLIPIVIGSLLLIASINNVQAQWAAIKESGYAITTDKHGQIVLIGESVTAWAGTTDSAVDGVEFWWLDPAGNKIVSRIEIMGPFITPNCPEGAPREIINWAGNNTNIAVYYAKDTRIPTVVGDWGVQANFYDPTAVKTVRGRCSDIIKIRATSFMVVPETTLGTMAVLLSMFGAFGVYTIRKKRIF